MRKRFWEKIGIELEGGWNEEPSVGSFHGDGSVSGLYTPIVGECVSSPMVRLADMDRFMETAYPDECNSTCGLHVHLSLLSNGLYSSLMSDHFRQYFLAGLCQWGREKEITNSRFWDRLNGRNSYAKTTYADPDYQASRDTKQECRYHAINFCFGLHGTVEFRVLPMFNKIRWAVLAVREIVALVNFYLANYHENVDLFEEIEIDETREEKEEELCV